MAFILDSIENLFSTLMLNTPLARFGAVTAASAVLFYIMKPSMFFTDSGEAKSWSFFAAPADQATATVLPYWLAAALLGAAASLFI